MTDERDTFPRTEIDPDSERFDNEGGHIEPEEVTYPDRLPTNEIDPDSLVRLEEDEERPTGQA